MTDLPAGRSYLRRPHSGGRVSNNGADNHVVRTIGQRLTRERIVRSLSLEEVAQRAGISVGLLSQLERGIGNPSLSTLQALAHAMDMPLAAFFVGVDQRSMVVRAAHRKRVVLSDRKLVYEMLVPNLERVLLMVQVEFPSGFSNESLPYSHVGEECDLVLEGRVEAWVGGERSLLNPGDSITFDAAIPHWFCTFEERAVVISAMTPPSL